MIEVGIEESAFWHIMSEGRVVMIPSQHVVGVIDQSWGVRIYLGEIGWPHSTVSVFSLMHGEIGRPYSIVDNSLPVVPFLEIISFVFLVSWVEFG